MLYSITIWGSSSSGIESGSLKEASKSDKSINGNGCDSFSGLALIAFFDIQTHFGQASLFFFREFQ